MASGGCDHAWCPGRGPVSRRLRSLSSYCVHPRAPLPPPSPPRTPASAPTSHPGPRLLARWGGPGGPWAGATTRNWCSAAPVPEVPRGGVGGPRVLGRQGRVVLPLPPEGVAGGPAVRRQPPSACLPSSRGVVTWPSRKGPVLVGEGPPRSAVASSRPGSLSGSRGPFSAPSSFLHPLPWPPVLLRAAPAQLGARAGWGRASRA